MNYKHLYLVLLFFICFSLFESDKAHSQYDIKKIRFNYGIDYTSGSYGGGEQTEIIYTPFSIHAEYGLWSISAVIPWLKVSGPALILDGAEVSSLGVQRSEGVSGLGDISWKLMYTFQGFYERGFFVDLTGRVKLPTASFSDGLGTGKLDASLQIDVAKDCDFLVPFFTLGRKWVGSPDTINLDNIIFASIGIQFNASDKFTSGILYDYRQSSIIENSNSREGLAYINIPLDDRLSINVYGVVGFSNNSPGKGIGVNFTYQFSR